MKAAGLVYVRTSDGTVKLDQGEAVPAEADADHVARLRVVGCIVEDEPRRGRRESASDSA